MRSKKNMPIILGINPPTKDVMLMKMEKPLKGYALRICHADFPEGTKRGDNISLFDKRIKWRGEACWIQFTDADVMRRFGQMIVDFANGEDNDKLEKKEGREIECQK